MERVDALERIIGSRPIVGTMTGRDPADIINEALAIGAALVVLDSPGTIAAELASEARRANVAVVVAPRIEQKSEAHGRGTITVFKGYERVGENGDLTPIPDRGLEREIELVRQRKRN